MKRRAFLCLIPILFVVGCAVKTSPQYTYTISDIKSPVGKENPKTQLTLLVANIVANPGYQTSDMLYVIKPYQLQPFANNHWVAPPADLLTSLISERIRNANYFKAVVGSTFPEDAAYRLDIRLLVLQQEFLQPVSEVRMSLQATLTNNAERRVVASREFHTVVEASENSPYGGVLATQHAARMLSQEIADFVVSEVKKNART